MENIKPDILRSMDRYISKWKSEGDRRYIFLNCYRLMTGNMMGALDQDRFEDKDWVHLLLHHFADYYFDALNCYECNSNTPAVWRQVHELTCTRELHTIQCLLTGVNAHINYDLTLSLYDLLKPEWDHLSENERKIRFRDHCEVNRIIAETIDAVQDEILKPEDPALGYLDLLMGRMDELVISSLISKWRQEVWDNAIYMLSISETEELEKFRLTLEQKVLKTGDRII